MLRIAPTGMSIADRRLRSAMQLPSRNPFPSPMHTESGFRTTICQKWWWEVDCPRLRSRTSLRAVEPGVPTPTMLRILLLRRPPLYCKQVDSTEARSADEHEHRRPKGREAQCNHPKESTPIGRWEARSATVNKNAVKTNVLKQRIFICRKVDSGE